LLHDFLLGFIIAHKVGAAKITTKEFLSEHNNNNNNNLVAMKG
jgi:hypothetical protein